LISDGAGRTMRVKVKLPSAITDLTSGALSAIKVFLTGMGDNPDTAEVLFTPTATTEQSVTLVQPTTGPLTYTYKVTGFNRVGVPVKGATGEESGLTLIVPIPTP
jgi:hypothetical protein